MTRTEQQTFKAQGSDQRFLSAHAAISDAFKLQPHLIRRPTLRRLRAVAHKVWADATVAAWGTGQRRKAIGTAQCADTCSNAMSIVQRTPSGAKSS